MYIANLQPESEQNQLKDLRSLFLFIDTNKDGILNLVELQQAIQTVLDKSSVDLLQDVFTEMDMNNNGEIEYNEFLTAAAKKDILLTDENLLQAFAKLDSNKDGFITQRSIQKAFGLDA